MTFVALIGILVLLLRIRSDDKEIAHLNDRADEGWQHAENEHQRAVLLECKCNKLIGEKEQCEAILRAVRESRKAVEAELAQQVRSKNNFIKDAQAINGMVDEAIGVGRGGIVFKSAPDSVKVLIAHYKARLKKAHR